PRASPLKLYQGKMTAALPRSASRSLHDLRASLQRGRAELLESTLASARGAAPETLGVTLGRRHARILDELLLSLFQALRSGESVSDQARAVPPGAWDAVELAGVGSYGRGAVALKSDLDVRILTKSTEKAAAVADALL